MVDNFESELRDGELKVGPSMAAKLSGGGS
jgi:hypothetical protein